MRIVVLGYSQVMTRSGIDCCSIEILANFYRSRSAGICIARRRGRLNGPWCKVFRSIGRNVNFPIEANAHIEVQTLLDLDPTWQTLDIVSPEISGIQARPSSGNCQGLIQALSFLSIHQSRSRWDFKGGDKLQDFHLLVFDEEMISRQQLEAEIASCLFLPSRQTRLTNLFVL